MPEYKGPHAEALTPITLRELVIATTLVFFAVLFGVYPAAYSITCSPRSISKLSNWRSDRAKCAAAHGGQYFGQRPNGCQTNNY